MTACQTVAVQVPDSWTVGQVSGLPLDHWMEPCAVDTLLGGVSAQTTHLELSYFSI